MLPCCPNKKAYATLCYRPSSHRIPFRENKKISKVPGEAAIASWPDAVVVRREGNRGKEIPSSLPPCPPPPVLLGSSKWGVVNL